MHQIVKYSVSFSQFLSQLLLFMGLAWVVCHSCGENSLARTQHYTLFPPLACLDIGQKATLSLTIPDIPFYFRTCSSQLVILSIIPICSIYLIMCSNCPSPSMYGTLMRPA